MEMKVLNRRCAGLDVHKAEVVACARVFAGRKVVQEVRRFGTTTRELMALGDWLESLRVTHVAMEATGVYWKPERIRPRRASGWLCRRQRPTSPAATMSA